jgi:hypothetical protein
MKMKHGWRKKERKRRKREEEKKKKRIEKLHSLGKNERAREERINFSVEKSTRL